MLLRAFASIVLVLLFTAGAAAQGRRTVVVWEPWESSGTVAGYRNGALLMKLEGQPWVGALSPASKISITGHADRDVLRPGLVVRLSAEFDQKTGAALQPVSEVTIATQRPGERLGILPDEVIDPTERKNEPRPTARLRVFDAISGVKHNTLYFKKYHVELTPDAKINVDFASPAALSEGDTIKKVKGRRIQGVPGRLVVEELEAELAGPLSGKKKTRIAGAKSRENAERNPDERDNKELLKSAGDDAQAKKVITAPGKKRTGKRSGDALKRSLDSPVGN